MKTRTLLTDGQLNLLQSIIASAAKLIEEKHVAQSDEYTLTEQQITDVLRRLDDELDVLITGGYDL